MENIVKVYSDGTEALKGVDFEVEKGQIKGLLGENGAGKTTLMRILYGELKPTDGKVYVGGREARFSGPWDALSNGIGMVHQHFTLVPIFTVLENLALAKGGKSLSTIDYRSVREKAQQIMDSVGFKVPLESRVEDLPVGVQQRVEILKVMLRDVNILILDEPTSVLTPLEVKDLFNLLRKLRERGVSIIFITHKLREVKEITDTITVLRKGVVVGRVKTESVSETDLAKMMVGREILLRVTRRPRNPGKEIFRVENLRVLDDEGREAVKGISFMVREGEILGVAGVTGNGQRELVEAITGLRNASSGKVFLNGVEVTNFKPRKLYRNGLAHIPADRHGVGLILDFNISENSILGLHHDKPFESKGFLRSKEVLNWVSKLISKFGVITSSLDSPARFLSGGNQQKLIAGREMMKEAQFIVADQPTHGLDVAATEYIRNLLLEMRSRGKAVLLVSTDLEEILQLSDRIVVMYEGKIIGEAKPEELDEEKLGLMMGGVKSE